MRAVGRLRGVTHQVETLESEVHDLKAQVQKLQSVIEAPGVDSEDEMTVKTSNCNHKI